MRVVYSGFGRLCFATVLLLNAGCGDGRPTLVPVTGTVTLNGQPVDGALVGFEPQGIEGYNRPSIATTDAQGKFVVGTYDKADGMPKGSYKVSVLKKDPIGKLPENFNTEDTAANPQPVKYQWTVPQKYSSTADSGLTVEVTSDGLNPSTIALTGEAEVENSSGAVPPP